MHISGHYSYNRKDLQMLFTVKNGEIQSEIGTTKRKNNNFIKNETIYNLSRLHCTFVRNTRIVLLVCIYKDIFIIFRKIAGPNHDKSRNVKNLYTCARWGSLYAFK